MSQYSPKAWRSTPGTASAKMAHRGTRDSGRGRRGPSIGSTPGPQPSSGGYFKPRESGGSGLRADPVDRHEEFGLPAQSRGGVRRLEELLSNIDGTRQGRCDTERKGPRIHLPPGAVPDRMPSRLERFDDSREEAGDCVREDLHILTERFVHPIDIGPQVCAASVERPSRETPLAFPDDDGFAIPHSLSRNDVPLASGPVLNRVTPDLVSIDDQGNPERLILLEAASDH